MPDFPHLKLPFKVEGRTRPFSGRGRNNPESEAITNANKSNRKSHGQYLENSANNLKENWRLLVAQKKENGIQLPNENDIPIFLKIDTSIFDIDSLPNWGIEIISEEKNGYIIGASIDDLELFQKNVNQFIKEEGKYKDTAAKIWELVTDDSWRVQQLLNDDLGKIWDQISPTKDYTVQLGVSCYVHNKKSYPNRELFDSEELFLMKVDEFKKNELQLQIDRDEKQILRENEVEKYVNNYNGEIHDIWSNEVDALYIKITISGDGLKDLVQTYQYLYEVKLNASYVFENENIKLDDDYQVEIIPPTNLAAKVCVIDSGIQENHILLKKAIDSTNSKSYVDGDSSVADYVKFGGHGTKVAGAVIYPMEVPKSGVFQLESIIQNARILDRKNEISKSRFEDTIPKSV